MDKHYEQTPFFFFFLSKNDVNVCFKKKSLAIRRSVCFKNREVTDLKKKKKKKGAYIEQGLIS